MPKPTHDLHLDFETYCDLDLKKVGVHRYVADPSFEVMCVAWKMDGRATQQAVCRTHVLPPDLVQALRNPDVQGHAFNAAFETAVLDRLSVFIANPLSCTMQRALAYGLPGNLASAAHALGLVHQKDMAGHRLMLRMSRPLKPGEAAWAPPFYDDLAGYCAKDVEAEAALAAVIPELQPDEAELSRLDAAMNVSGELGIDLNRVCTFMAVAEDAEKADAKRCAKLTQNTVTSPGTQTARLLSWLAARGLVLEDTQRATIEEELANGGQSPDVEEVLEIRLRMARASTRKLLRMLDMASSIDRALRGQFQFCGAGRTGRWSGRGVQVQNLPRVPKGFSPDLFYDMALACTIRNDGTAFDAVTSAPVLDCVSWSLRSCLKAADDKKVLWSFDFSQIEARVLAWLAGQHDILNVFADGDDVYLWAAARFGSSDRQLGKVLVLALGFGMGATKLRETAWKNYGVRMTAAQAERFKAEWRLKNYKIVAFWYDMENAAKAAIIRQGQVVPVGGSGVAFTCTTRTLQMRLPSGRVLYYHKPRLDRDTASIVYWGAEVGGRWVEQRTWGGKLAENATQAAARDIMSEAMLRAFRRIGAVPCMTVHDELVYPLDRAACGWSQLETLMLEPPPWAGGLPLAGEHKIMRRYGIDVSHKAIAKPA
jgi:DNA polymerase bacteriophage-type